MPLPSRQLLQYSHSHMHDYFETIMCSALESSKARQSNIQSTIPFPNRLEHAISATMHVRGPVAVYCTNFALDMCICTFTQRYLFNSSDSLYSLFTVHVCVRNFANRKPCITHVFVYTFRISVREMFFLYSILWAASVFFTCKINAIFGNLFVLWVAAGRFLQRIVFYVFCKIFHRWLLTFLPNTIKGYFWYYTTEFVVKCYVTGECVLHSVNQDKA